MIAHLLESTLLLALAIVIAHLPRLAARTRFSIVFAALMKFAIPSAIVPRVLVLSGIDLARMPKGTIIIDALGPLSVASPHVTSAPVWPAMAIASWLVIAAALVARAFIRGRRGMRLALSGAFDADAVELEALDRARARAGVARTLRLVHSPSITAPATAGVLRPVIVIPAATQLADAELETLLTHECAHIARHDNLLSVVESIAGCALWFHPLVWIARRLLDTSREEACDAIVVASGDAGIYVTALGRVCGAAIAPRTAGISCIVSKTFRERMEAIMQLGTRRLLPHRTVTATVIAFLAIATIGSGVARAMPAPGDDSSTSPYKVDVTATRLDSLFDFFVTIRDRKDGQIIQSARVKSNVEEWGTARAGRSEPDGEHSTVVRAKGHRDGTATVEVQIDQTPPVSRTIVARPAHAAKAVAKGSEPISLDLKDADIRDLLRTFAQFTNTEIVVDDDVTGKVTESLREVPWTEALDKMLADANLRQERTGNTIHVHRR